MFSHQTDLRKNFCTSKAQREEEGKKLCEKILWFFIFVESVVGKVSYGLFGQMVLVKKKPKSV